MTLNDSTLIEEIRRSVRDAVLQLFQNTGESFYYFSLITTGEAHAPFISAWSWEQLALVSECDRLGVKWSYADSPYCGYGSELFFGVGSLFAQLPNLLGMEEADRWAEYDARLRAMETALAILDKDGLFGRGRKRNEIFINVEVMPPDYTNTMRAMRLNPPLALKDWLEEAAE